ncbi:MAG: hypothetical protein IPM51_12385, partial [Sphingobacteriaceae bacterium]|nr:hypothetical protein [Sphingobacteriaceae bacterium]
IYFIGICLLVSAVATSRIIFIILPPLLGVLLWKRNKYFGVGLAIIGLVLTLLLHIIFYTAAEVYQPFHLFERAEINLRIPLIVLGGIVSAIGGFFVMLKVKPDFTSWLFWFAFSLTIPLIFISFGELKNVEFNFSKWEGANYIFPAVPAILIYIFYGFSDKTQNEV